MAHGGRVSSEREFRSGRAVGAARRPTGPVISLVIVAGSALLLTSAAIHLHLWADGYRYKATIGPLFFAQGVAGVLLSLAIALVRRVSVAVLGALFAAGTIAALLVSVHVGPIRLQIRHERTVGEDNRRHRSSCRGRAPPRRRPRRDG